MKVFAEIEVPDGYDADRFLDDVVANGIRYQRVEMPSAPRLSADEERVAKLMRGLAERNTEMAEERGETDLRFDTIGIVAIVAWNDANDVEREDAVAAFESRRHYIQTGILTDLLLRRSC